MYNFETFSIADFNTNEETGIQSYWNLDDICTHFEECVFNFLTSDDKSDVIDDIIRFNIDISKARFIELKMQIMSVYIVLL